jgi:hypothetical protein
MTTRLKFRECRKDYNSYLTTKLSQNKLVGLAQKWSVAWGPFRSRDIAKTLKNAGRHYSKLESDGGKAPTVPGRIGPLGEEVDPFYSVNRRCVVIPSSQPLALPIGLSNRSGLDYDSGRRYSRVD